MKIRTPHLIILLIIISGIVFSCENKINLIPKSDFLTLPSVTVKDFETTYTDSGKLQVILTSPLMEQYDNTKIPYNEFRLGINVVYYNGQKAPVASVTSKYAKYTKTNNMWELKDSVVLINETKDKLETEVLNWDQQKNLIYTDRFVKITTETEIIQGFGLESDPQLVKRKIKKVSAIIYLPDAK